MKNKKIFEKLHKFNNDFHTLLARVFGLKHEIDNKKYRRAIYNYLTFNDAKELCISTTYIKAFKHKENIIVEIETHRPGLLIGKGGSFINELKIFIEEKTNQKISIELRESKLWMNMYDHK